MSRMIRETRVKNLDTDFTDETEFSVKLRKNPCYPCPSSLFNGLPSHHRRGSQRPTQREERVFNKVGDFVANLVYIGR